MAVIERSELALLCFVWIEFYRYGVTYCSRRDHSRMANRGVATAHKIGARYLATKKGLKLWPWDKSVSANAIEGGTHVSAILRDALSSFRNGTFTF